MISTSSQRWMILFSFLWFIGGVTADCEAVTSDYGNDLVRAYESVAECQETIVLIVDREIRKGPSAVNITDEFANRTLELITVESGRISTNVAFIGFDELRFISVNFTKDGSLHLSNIRNASVYNCSFAFYPQNIEIRDLEIIVSLYSENVGILYVSDSSFVQSYLGILMNGGRLAIERSKFNSNINGGFELRETIVEGRDLTFMNNTSIYGVIRLINCTGVLERVRMDTNIALTSGGSIAISKESHIILNQISIVGSVSTVGGGGLSIVGSGRTNITNLSLTSAVSSQGGGVYISQDDGTKLEVYIQYFWAQNVSSYRDGGAVYVNGADFHLGDAIMKQVRSLNGGSVFMAGNINNSIIENIRAFDSSVEVKGGAIRSVADINNLIIRNSTFHNCTSLIGGALSISGSANTFLLESTEFEFNKVLLYGGSIDMDGRINSFRMIGGSIIGSDSPLGGGFRITKAKRNEITFEGTRFIGNGASDKGGGLLISGTNSSVSIINSTFDDNHSDSVGGAVEMEGSFLSISFQDCSITNNQATGGGGINLKADISFLMIKDCSFDNNTAFASDGGGLYLDGRITSIEVKNSQFLNNQAINGGGWYSSLVNTNFIIQSNEFSNNIAINGGGYSLNKKSTLASESSSSIIMIQNRFAENRASIGRDIEMNQNRASIRGNQITDGGFFISQNSTVSNEDKSGIKSFVCPSGLIPTQTANKDQVSCKNEPPKGLTGMIIGVTVGVVAGGIFTGAIVYFLIRLRRQKRLIKKQRIELEDWSNVDLGAAKSSLLDLNEFKDMEEVGRGAFGIVYCAHWRELTIAVKQMKDVSGITKQMTEFLREVAILQRLRAHPNVVLFLGITVPPQNLSLVTEFCEGGSLYHYLRKNEVSENQRYKFIDGIAKGLLHLHLEGVIHRDLAVRNILLTKHLEVKVSDFGLSREASEDACVTTTSVGPLKWMAPEAILRREYSTKSDVFSFGVVIWEILTSKDPWEGLGVLEAAMAVANEGARLPIYPSFNEDLAQIMKECWETNPQDRPEFSTICSSLDTSNLSSGIYPQMHKSGEYLDTTIHLDQNMYISTDNEKPRESQSEDNDSTFENDSLMESTERNILR